MPIIVGAPRSGATLLRFMLDTHPEMAIPPETGFIALFPHFKSKGDALREEFFRSITNFPPDATAWQDFQITKETFWKKLLEIEPFAIGDGYRSFETLMRLCEFLDLSYDDAMLSYWLG